ncbi:YdiK family protein [Bacillus sp. REN10]|uniref:YdiK family protein n=1 Tax=Bacillus sp. REN10 TaxID=2782541 RepID=UPI00193B77C3|nr:YdiK family protein [Bacillus sp. REN10]
MTRSPLKAGIFYLLLGAFFTYLAIEDVNSGGFGFFTYVLILLATMDIGSGIRLVFIHFRLKNSVKK